ncbi:MAG: ferritin-like domain-containing protein [Myxococcota bacterium]|nr:ferritin-like domain-containing protein [Myxococcota bacterium]
MHESPLLVSILAVLAGCGPDEGFEARGCIPASEDQASCPAKRDVSLRDVFLPGRCGDDLEVVEMKSEGELTTLTSSEDETTTPACCYTVVVVDHDESSECVVGRPYYDQGAPRRAPVSPPVTEQGSAAGVARRRAAAWSNAGAAEHASVAAFGRLALQLMALGAPLDLVRDTHHAALDEIGHSELCWSLARRFGEPVQAAGPFPFSGPIDPNLGLAELAVELVRDGCVEETLGAHLAFELAAAAPEADVRAVLTTIAAEESQHAVLSFRILTWALQTGGEPVRAAVRSAIAEPAALRLALGELSLRSGVDLAALCAMAERGVREVLEPARERLLSITRASR